MSVDRAPAQGGIAAATAAVAGFFFAAVLPRATQPLVDPDVWWHIRAGEEVIRTGGVPRTNTWSLVEAGGPWTSQDWLGNVVLAIGHAAGPWGQTLLSLGFGALAVGAFWILWRAIAIRLPEVGWASRATWLSVGLLLAGPVMGVRVQVLDLAFAAASLWILWRYTADSRRRWLVLLPVLAMLWANLHAGWVLLFLLGGATLVGEAVDRLASRRPAGGLPLRWRNLSDLAVALLVSAAAVAFNPNGIDLLRYPFDTVGMTALGRYVLEWAPASLESLFGWLLLGYVLVGVVPTLLVARARLRTADALVLVGLTIMAWRAIRFLLILGPLGAAIVCVALAPVIWRSPLGRKLSPILVRLQQPRRGRLGAANAALAAIVVTLGIGISAGRVVPEAQREEIAREMPVAAVGWLQRNDPGDRIFNRYEWGGYLGLHRPHKPVFMDGRADVYGDEAILRYVSVIGLSEDPGALLDEYDIDHALFPPNWELAGWFDASPAWERVYADATAAIWVRR